MSKDLILNQSQKSNATFSVGWGRIIPRFQAINRPLVPVFRHKIGAR